MRRGTGEKGPTVVPVITLTAATLLARLIGFLGVDALDWQTSLRIGLAAMFLLTGTVHFAPAFRDDMTKMVPPNLPRPAALVALTGVLEIAGAVGLLIPATATAAALCLALLLIAMFPANVSAARRGIPLAGRPATPLGIRTAEQILFIGLAVLAAL
ncbi:DoxX family protein [Glycomyces sp. TRM65418]|uniref:DoxX family protein n=1 Tax=Glycomyces sp. TRM65418 TaxID=2867006 RepID=UPI001CE4FD81|nr:DoxX family protein [Glycomyces sp. TRM65418]MCC3763253.1 DoxX family protein [Glycomyces sp. TRM65418]QZD57254.1 DoxX family protein [Glycomyces sp. TRM65418]